MANVDADILAILDEEREYATSQARFSMRLQLERGDTALVRFLPVQMGARKLWFLRVGRHWINRRPYLCKRTSSPDIGGDPDYACPLCEMCEEHLQSRDEDTANAAFRATANPQWVVYCVVWERGERGRDPRPVPRSELYVPYETWVTRDAWLELSAIMKRSQHKGELPLGILDPERGCDIWMTKDKRGVLHFDKQDSQPIDDKDPKGLMAKILSKVKLQEFRPVSGVKMDEALDKLEDAILGGGRRRREGGEGEGRRDGRGEADDYPERRGRGHGYEPGEGEEPDNGGARAHGICHGGEDDRSPAGGRREPEGGEPEPRPRHSEAPPEREQAPEAPRRPAGRSLEPLEDDGNSEAGEADAGGADAGADEPPPRVRASPPPSVRRTGPLPPAPARARVGWVDEVSADVSPFRYDPAPTPARPKVPLGEAVRRGVRAVQDASGEDGGGMPPPRRPEEE